MSVYHQLETDSQNAFTTVENTINQVIEDPLHRILLKHFLDGCEISDIARFAYISEETVTDILQYSDCLLKKSLGVNLDRLVRFSLNQRVAYNYSQFN